jgi:phasin family protein
MHFAVTLRWSWCGANQEKTNMATTPNYAQFVATAKEQVEKSTSQFLKSFESLNALTKQNVDAFVKSSSILAKGFEDISKSTVDYTQSTLENGAAVGKQALAVKTIRDLVDLQSSFAKKSFDSAIAEGTKVSEISVKVANEAFQPISAQINATLGKLTKPLAA